MWLLLLEIDCRTSGLLSIISGFINMEKTVSQEA
jgi:hypothetical protein